MNLEDLTDKRAVVTGGSRGIGCHIAAALHEAGAHVVITSRHADALNQAAKKIGPRCHPYVCDQSDPDAVRNFADRVHADLGPVDILVCNAASLSGGGPVAEMTLADWQFALDANLTGTFLTVQSFLPDMIERQRGDIVMISSMSGKIGDPGGSAYSACKFGLQGFSQSLNYEVRKHNIRVMVINPSAVNTGDDDHKNHGPGLYLHAADIAATVVHLVQLPGRTLIRDMDIWGTNPFPA
ncbi:MAG: hypothetical protein CMJ49_14385 [Planctomycetaceae bacterium]|nr:hypothetical protein [Planctomycetaceae bacterium]